MIVIVFVESKHILPDHITNTGNKYSFASLPVIKGRKSIMEMVILFIYKNNM